MRRAALLGLFALVGVSRADEPPPTSITCDATGCGGVRYDDLFRRGLASPPSDRWAPIGDDLGFKATSQPVEGDRAAEAARLRELLERLERDGDGLQDVELDGDGMPPRLGGPSTAPVIVAEPAVAARGERRPVVPDDREFLDVVLVGGERGFHCTGLLVAPTAVLTAAHCAPAAVVGFGHRATRLFARVTVASVTPHPTLDVALLRLDRAVPLPIRARRRAIDDAAPAAMVRLVGFGVDDVRHPTSFGVKRRADVHASGWGCDRGRARSARCRPGAELLLTAVGGTDTCRGDSGGPVLEPTVDGFRLLAITSRSTASGGATCGRGGIYVRADVIDPWLTSLLEKRP